MNLCTLFIRPNTSIMKFRLLLITLVCFTTISAQDISGVAYYESKTTMNMDEWGRRDMSEEMKRQIAERMRQYLEKTFILTFNGNEAIYKEEEKLEAGAGGRGFGMMMSSFSAGDQYKNIETNQILEEREFFGKEFLINDTLTNLEWEIGKESKQIGQYLAIKATAMKAIDENDMSFARRRGRNRDRDANKEEENAEAEKQTDSTAAKEEDPWEQIEVPKEIIVTAWFTPQIPVGHGPGEYAGLPGLILELNYYRTTLLCSKIVINPKEPEKIVAPTKGKAVTRKEYNEIVKVKMDEMRENFRGRGGRNGRRPGGQ